MFSLELFGGFHWSLALTLGAPGYWSVRYTGYLVSERRFIKRKMQEAREAGSGWGSSSKNSTRDAGFERSYVSFVRIPVGQAFESPVTLAHFSQRSRAVQSDA